MFMRRAWLIVGILAFVALVLCAVLSSEDAMAKGPISPDNPFIPPTHADMNMGGTMTWQPPPSTPVVEKASPVVKAPHK